MDGLFKAFEGLSTIYLWRSRELPEAVKGEQRAAPT